MIKHAVNIESLAGEIRGSHVVYRAKQSAQRQNMHVFGDGDGTWPIGVPLLEIVEQRTDKDGITRGVARISLNEQDPRQDQ